MRTWAAFRALLLALELGAAIGAWGAARGLEEGDGSKPALPPDAGDEAATTFQLGRDPATGEVTSLRRSGDVGGPDFIRPGSKLGPVWARVRAEGGPWFEVRGRTNGVALAWRIQPVGDALRWETTVTNTGPGVVEIGDLAFPLPLNTDYAWEHEETFVRRVFRHAFVGGSGSFVYWLPVKGSGWFLVLQPAAGTALEYFTATDMDYAWGRERFTVYAHSKAAADLESRGSWRQARTSRMLRPGEGAAYRFDLRWARSHEGVRELLRQHGGVDVHVAPGLVLPRDLEARLALRTGRALGVPVPEFPDRTTIEEIGRPAPDTIVYRLRFRRLGENRITVRGADGWEMPVEFFVTEPLEVLIRKRADFVVRNQQHRDPAKWYDGLFSLWDRRQPEGRNLLGPDHPAGQHPYAVSGSDDPSNGKSLLVAEKNVAHPDAAEVAALEYFVSRFVWGRHQRTATETPYPYGIYGSDSWRQNRFSERDPLAEGISRPGGPSACRMWRTFDYPTYFALYYDLYRIARQRPDLVTGLDAAGYLERAWGTAHAYFEVPAGLRMEGGWSFNGWVYWQYTTGNFHEKYLLPLIAALEAEGWPARADQLRADWEKKVKYFVYDHPWPFASEMPVDSTAYESTYAAACYAVEHGLRPDENLWYDRNRRRWYSHPLIDPARHAEFLGRQHLANLACRGVLEPSYTSLGSDFRGCGPSSYTLSYMSAMGGWAVLDHALRHQPEPAADLRLGYASMLASWALMNSGDAESGYGFWTPGPRHDGAMSWGFQPRQVGAEWLPTLQDQPRGAWPVCGEADHGLVAAIEGARTVLFDDPMFGRYAYGGEVLDGSGGRAVIPRDGVRQRFSAVLGRRRLHVELDRDGFARDQPIVVREGLDGFTFQLESRAPGRHSTQVTVEGLPPGPYVVSHQGRRSSWEMREGSAAVFELGVDAGPGVAVGVEPLVGAGREGGKR